MKHITVQELKQLLENKPENAAFIDVREQNEWDTGHIEGMELKPLSRISEWAGDMKGYDAVYLQCRSGGRSSTACEFLENQGIKNTINVDGGILDWVEAGYPVA